MRQSAPELAAVVFGLGWLVGVGVYLWSGTAPAGGVGIAVTALGVMAPLALTGFTLGTLRSIRALRAEAVRLQATMDQMRVSFASSQQQAQAAAAQRQPSDRAADRTTTARSTAETAAATAAAATEANLPSVPFASRRDRALTVPSADRKAAMLAPRPASVSQEQPGLALGTPLDDNQTPPEMEVFLRAIHFPEGPEDAQGFQALRVALTHRTTAKLIRAAQDVLTLLAQDGIYMDDLNPDRARPELWRKFAAGERGRAIAGLGGVRDRSCLALTAARMREDAVFRDAAHHFLRSFDKAIAAMEPNATDSELSFLSDTRTARAFMLFGRVTGTFD